MIDLQALNPANLGSSATFESLRAEADRLIQARDSQPAQALFRVLQRLLPAEANHPLRAQYRPILQDLSLISLPSLETDAILKLLDEYLISYLIHPAIDLSEQISQRIRTLSEPERSAFTRSISARLEANSRSLSAGPLAVGGGRYAPATLANWIAEYRRSLPPGSPAETRTAFFNENSNWLALDSTQQATLKRLFTLVDLCAKPARTGSDAAASERMAVRVESGQLRYFSHGQLGDFWQPGQAASQLAPSAAPTFTPSPRLVADEQVRLEARSARQPVPVVFELPDDEAEIRHHTDQLNSLKVGGSHDISAIINNIIQSHGLRFPDPLLQKRFQSVAEARLKEIRNTIETRDMLGRPPKIGGLGLAPELVQALIADLETAARRIRDELPKPIPPPPKPIPPVAPPPPRVPAPPPVFKPAPTTPAPPPLRSIPPPPPPIRRPAIQRPIAEAHRPVLEDIRRPAAPAPRLVGPVEELGGLTLDDFRNLGDNNAAGSVRKVFSKINLLGQESFARKAEGIKAWRQSPVYQLYLEQSSESLETGRAIGEIVRARQARGQPSLTETELHAIIDLSKRLRF